MKFLTPFLLTLCIIFTSLSVKATPILFDFESGDETNPAFTEGGLTSTFSAIGPLTTQRVSDDRSVPFAGDGSMRLTTSSFGQMAVAGRVDFSSLLSSVSLWAIDLSMFDNDFIISALSTGNTVLDTVEVVAGGYTFVEFSGLGPIAALSFTANTVNTAYWDNLTATVTVSSPSTLSLFLVVTIGFIYQYRRS